MKNELKLSEINSYTGRCIHDEAAPCSAVCPFHLNLRSFLKKLSKGRFSAAYKEFRTAAVFPSIAAALCEGPCEGRCQRTRIGDEPVAVRNLEKAVLKLSKPQAPDVFQIPEKEERIAVIGAGAAGLSLALCMAQKKYPVTVFEAREGFGGRLMEHPDFAVFEEDIRFQTSREKIEYRFGKRIASLSELEGFSAVYVASGRDGEDFGLLASWDPKYCTTSEKNVFMGGEICGMSVCEGVAAGRDISRYMESMIMAGRITWEEPAAKCDPPSLVPEGAAPAPRIAAADAGGYSKDEAKQEASRCFLCNCEKCLKGCELLNKYGKPPVQMGNEILADTGAHFLSSRTMTRETYSCNQCGWCESICPEKVGMGNIFHLSRTERVIKGIQPEAFHDYWLRELEFVSKEAFYAALPKGRTACSHAFFPGCQAGAVLPRQVIAAGEWLKENYDAGIVLGCCGASAYWAGESCENNTALLRSAWEKLGRPVFVAACATCCDMLQRFLPEIETVSLYELLAEKKVSSQCLQKEAALFDPCAARENEPMKSSVRRIGEEAGCMLYELSEKGRCCGFGGHMRTAAGELYDTIVKNRSAMSELPYLVYCANCREVFLEKDKPCRHILEYVFGPEERHYTLQEKKENRLAVKSRFLMLYEGKEEVVKSEKNEMKLLIPEEVRAEMERQLVTDGDVAECIQKADGGRFESDQGTFLACMVKKVITYWVEYKELPDGFGIVNVYCHRMKIAE